NLLQMARFVLKPGLVCKTAGSAYAGSNPASPIAAIVAAPLRPGAVFALVRRISALRDRPSAQRAPSTGESAGPRALQRKLIAISRSHADRTGRGSPFPFGPIRARCVG